MPKKFTILTLLIVVSMLYNSCTRKTLPCEELPDLAYDLREPPSKDVQEIIAANFAGCRKRTKRHLGNAVFSVGLSLLYGLGAEKNPAKAFTWLKASADREHEAGKKLVGQMFFEGYGIAQDKEEANNYLSQR